MDRRATVRRVGVVILGVNLALAVAKALVWQATGSLAVGSEAVNSVADVAYSAVVVAGLYLTTQPPDFEHPHGHERIEPFVSLFVAAGVFVAGIGVAYSGATALLSAGPPRTITGGPLAVGVLVATGAVKLLLYRYCLRVGRRRDSPALVATALDNRNDTLTAAAALVGVLGVAAGYPALDALAAVAVSVGILYTGYEIVRDNVGYLVGAAPPEDLRGEILDRALSHPEVRGAHDVVAHYVGPEVDVSLHIEVEGERSLFEAHDIETEVVESIRALPAVDDVFVHVDPKELGEWKEADDARIAAEEADGTEADVPPPDAADQ
ncbi:MULTISPECIES: cation diffusion facilitator family transporter [Halobaculum]|uniref:Cation diffusion facilitator family transporter n=2 Tax=Halobaculum TaxID=43927 RepID=A0A8T8WBX8_9EURY|nr:MULTISPECIES: cation diffusion facilitator family transporter [Halobaculum]QZP37357.1 cation diffusion facilitator family transporter [Halobaculum magnesiiphilum]QZY02363.1 cation diffusion facilitator family transporter [Halobaculum roseum]